ncbi:MAG: bifunctional [glutamine synthetase] adenylyltransferase/[glutamine synthetase]-adenylyl-L-tyrosine phosphorylase, partial [Rhodospirillaceae bacterium]|nr:bifunctional [glutamine synthetase] adenylyltransferase/[glutamine synthetase]-adenylyl-L-tyrosine phosphorylase [Rhodospirillaceae bacterium]
MNFFEFDPKHIPVPADSARADAGWGRMAERAAYDPGLAEFVKSLKNDPVAGRLAESIFANSPFLGHCIQSDPEFTRELFTQGPDECRERVLTDTINGAKNLNEAELKKHLRIKKRQIQLMTGVADINCLWDLDRVTHTLSAFADAAVSAASSHLLGYLEGRGAIKIADPTNPELGSGLIILGLGKLGGRELNYSSDIDIIIMFDPDTIQSDKPEELQSNFVRLAKKLVSILDDRTADGYVFRTDLRLRPDPGSTPLAISTMAAESYYESIGQNWERAAMIKARPIAGDIAAGEKFLAFLKPFIWRKSLDFAAIDDIHSIKRQINAHRGGSKIKLYGHNIKLGRGGIREIEFFAQTQQLIWGGRNRDLRIAPTQLAIKALRDATMVKSEDAQLLIDSYIFLRQVEHRLQMVDDEQTHSLPDDDAGIEKIAIFLNFPNGKSFAEKIISVMHTVETIYAQLFEESPSLSSSGEEHGNLVFTGGESDPETLKTLINLGFKNVDSIDATVRGWHHGRYRCTRSNRARQILTELMPIILSAFGRTGEPDSAFMRFDSFLSKLPAGVQLFSMFQVNPDLLDLIAEIMGTAPRLAEHLSQKAGILDGVLNRDFFNPLPNKDDLKIDLDHALEEATCMEDVLDITRRWGKDKKFQIGVQVLRAILDERGSQRALSDVAEVLIGALQPLVEDDFAKTHGRIKDGAMAIIAFGKMGSREKTPTSDLDLIFVYDFDKSIEKSDGNKPLAPSQYFARLSQRLINALSAPTAEGSLYEVDMRLRPSGSSGPIATTVESFDAYQKNESWTWEHMALTRARAISGPIYLKKICDSIIHQALIKKRDPQILVLAVSDMRERIYKEHGTDTPWSIKHYRGGLVDVEFISQYLQLLHAHDNPDVLSTSTRVALVKMGKLGIVKNDIAEKLVTALDLWQSIQGLARLTTVHEMRKKNDFILPESLSKIFCQVANVKTLSELEEKMQKTADTVVQIYNEIITKPADIARQ